MRAEENTTDHNRRVLVIGADGMRPDTVDPQLMPTYAKLIEKGTLFTEFYAAYPPHTRVSMTTFTTGVYPGRHGVINNLMYIPGFHKDGLLQTGNDQHLLEYGSLMGEPFLLCPTLGDRLHARGSRLSVAGSGSPGASLLWNLNHPELVINPSSDYGETAIAALQQLLGEVPAESGGVKEQRAQWATRALIDVHLPNPDNKVMVLWLAEPDTALHNYGIGSPEACEALQVVDRCVAQVLEAIDRLGLVEQLDILLMSDHGHSSINAIGSLEVHLQRAVHELGLTSRFIVTSNNIYGDMDTTVQQADAAQLVKWLLQQEWCDAVFTSSSELMNLSGVMSMETLTGPIRHNRVPLLTISPKWSDDVNEFGVPGIVSTLTNKSSNKKSTHGSTSPFDLHAFCLGYGPSFREGCISDIPSGIVDIAPTICHLVGIPEETGFDGRVLLEGLKGSKDFPFEGEKLIIRSENSIGLCVAQVNGTRYVHGTVPGNERTIRPE